MAARAHRRRHDDEEHEGSHERWLVTYADMVTLLMVLFIILFSMSHVDEQKYKQLKDGLMASFGHTILPGDTIADTNQGGSMAQTTTAPDADLTPREQAQVDKAVQHQERKHNQLIYSEAQTEVKSLAGVWHQIHRALARQGLQDDVQATIDQRGLVVSLISRHVVFQPNVAYLSPAGRPSWTPSPRCSPRSLSPSRSTATPTR